MKDQENQCLLSQSKSGLSSGATWYLNHFVYLLCLELYFLKSKMQVEILVGKDKGKLGYVNQIIEVITSFYPLLLYKSLHSFFFLCRKGTG